MSMTRGQWTEAKDAEMELAARVAAETDADREAWKVRQAQILSEMPESLRFLFPEVK